MVHCKNVFSTLKILKSAEVAYAEFPKSTEVQGRFCRTLAARLIGLKQIAEYREEQSTDYKVRSQ